MQLRELHRQFMTAMYQPSVSAEAFVQASPLLSPNECLAIYRGSVRGGLLQALRDIYPVIHKLLGDQTFEGLSRRYIDKHPSRSADIARYGDRFAEFLSEFRPLSAFLYLADVAELEWAWHQVFNETDSAPLDLDKLALLSPEQQCTLKFSRPRASRLLSTSWPVKQIWEINQVDSHQQETIELVQTKCFLMVWRQAYDMQIEELDEAQWAFLNALDRSSNFSGAIEQFLADHPDENVSEIFIAAVTRGWIVTF